MTREILEQIAKAGKVNLAECTHVYSSVNDAFTKIETTFYIPDGTDNLQAVAVVKTSVNAIMKRRENVLDYETNGIKTISFIR